MKTIHTFAVLISAAILVCTVPGCGRTNGTSTAKMQVAVSIGPLGNFAKEVGGNMVDVHVLVQPGASPHTYQLSTDQMEMLSKASVLVLNGVNLEFWADKAVDAANNTKLIVVRTAEGLPIVGSDHGHDHEHEHEGGNPHVWLNPVYAIHQVEKIRDAFIKADPEHKAEYKENAARYINELKNLDSQIRAKVKTFTSRDFITFHSAWIYFAKEYGLREAAVIEETPGREPSPTEVGDIVKICHRIKAKAVFAEPQFSPKAAQVIADECGAKVLMLNPMGRPPEYNYIDMMHENLKQMTEAMGR